MENILVSSSPHIRSGKTTAGIMRDVCIALTPALLCSVIFFGARSLFLCALCVVFSVGFEYLWQKITKRKVTIKDKTALVTGLLLALNLPVTAPWWVCPVGAFVAIIIAKQFFGGTGHNFMNPAIVGRAFLLASWPVIMTRWAEPFTTGFFIPAEVVSSATPLAVLKDPAAGELPSMLSMFLGTTQGCLGETSTLAILLGGAYLVFRKVISLRIPLTYILTVAILSFIFPNTGYAALQSAGVNVLSGSLVFGAFFMATDYVTSPVTSKGQIVMGLGCGILTFVIRRFGGYPEGVSYAILLMNVATPLIDRCTMPKAFGTVKKRGGKN